MPGGQQSTTCTWAGDMGGRIWRTVAKEAGHMLRSSMHPPLHTVGKVRPRL